MRSVVRLLTVVVLVSARMMRAVALLTRRAVAPRRRGAEQPLVRCLAAGQGFAKPEAPAVTRAAAAGLTADTVDWKGLAKEARRRHERAVKKVAKKSSRLAVLEQASAGREEEEEYLECEAAMAAAAGERDALAALMAVLSSSSSSSPSSSSSSSSSEGGQAALDEANRLGLSDAPPARPPRVAKAKKPPPAKRGPRLPYATFASAARTEIRVGRSAKDNDVLSCDAKHRDSADWWLHAAGHAGERLATFLPGGSHVVVRSHDDDLPTTDRETLLDAACLAALYSKAVAKPGGGDYATHRPTGSARVSLCRAREVSKPPGSKPGLVQIRGDIRTLTVNLGNEHARLDRLFRTKDKPTSSSSSA